MRLYMNYCRPYKDKRLLDIASELGLEPWELGKILIERYMILHTELGLDINFMTNEEHFEIVLKHLKEINHP
jgi:hypothetical protein